MMDETLAPRSRLNPQQRAAVMTERGRRASVADAVRRALDPLTPRVEARRIARRLLEEHADLLTLPEVQALGRVRDDDSDDDPPQPQQGQVRRRKGREPGE